MSERRAADVGGVATTGRALAKDGARESFECARDNVVLPSARRFGGAIRSANR
ncbi:MAG: hypothetical protein M3Z05_09975 [Gemmatimonadota bacterium]|nr:hypothetical protein [Gemmatimonadota bacterium]